MDIMELGAIGELVGGVAVIASLLYVGLQVRQSTSVARANSHKGFIDSFSQWSLSVARDPALVRVWRDGCENRGGITADERGQLDWLLFSSFRILETIHYQSRLGFAERHLLSELEPGYVAVLSGAGAQEWWRENPIPFGAEFTQYVEGLLPGVGERREA